MNMDLIGELTSQLGTSEGQAKGLAGGLIGLVQSVVKDEVSEEAAQQLGSAVPEAKAWLKEGDTPEGIDDDGGGLGDLLGMGMGMLGASSSTSKLTAGVAKLIEKFGLEPRHAAIAAPLVAKFVESRIDPDLLAKVQPFLSVLGAGGDAGGAGGGGLGGLVGGLLG